MKLALMAFLDRNNRILLQHRSKDKKFYPDYWSFFGGSIEEGETPEKAVKREIKEELGIELKDFKFFRKYVSEESIGLIEKNIFIGFLNWDLETLKNQQNEEGQNLKLFSIDDINKIKIPSIDANIIREISDQFD